MFGLTHIGVAMIRTVILGDKFLRFFCEELHTAMNANMVYCEGGKWRRRRTFLDDAGPVCHLAIRQGSSNWAENVPTLFDGKFVVYEFIDRHGDPLGEDHIQTILGACGLDPSMELVPLVHSRE